MRYARPAVAIDPKIFGRRRICSRPPEQALLPGDDVRLFFTTFAAGFVFVAVLIA